MTKPAFMAIVAGTLASLLPAHPVWSQEFSSLKTIEFHNADEVRQYNPQALQCANYILSTPHEDADEDRLEATSFLIRWMSATSDYTFNLDPRANRLLGKTKSLLGEYMAALASYCLVNADDSISEEKMKRHAWHTLAVYCSDEKNNVPHTHAIRKLLNADEQGRLDNYFRN